MKCALGLSLPLLLTLPLTGCDPTPPKGVAPPPASASPATPAAGGLSTTAAGDLVGVYDYGQVVSLDDPDGARKVLTFAITTQRKLEGFEASLVAAKEGSPLRGLKLDFASQLLIVVVQPGERATPAIQSVTSDAEGTTVTYQASEEAKDAKRGRFVARIVPKAEGKVRFQPAQ